MKTGKKHYIKNYNCWLDYLLRFGGKFRNFIDRVPFFKNFLFNFFPDDEKTRKEKSS